MTELLASLSWLAVLSATVLYFILGALWYSPLLFAKAWMNVRNITEEDIGKPNPVIFLYAFVLQFIAVISLALFLRGWVLNLLQTAHLPASGPGRESSLRWPELPVFSLKHP